MWLCVKWVTHLYDTDYRALMEWELQLAQIFRVSKEDDYCTMANIQALVLTVACIGAVVVLWLQDRRLHHLTLFWEHSPSAAIVLCTTAAITVAVHIGELVDGTDDHAGNCPVVVGATVAWIIVQVGVVMCTQHEPSDPGSARHWDMPTFERLLKFQDFHKLVLVLSIMLNFVWTFSSLLKEGREGVDEDTDKAPATAPGCSTAGFKFHSWQTVRECACD